MRSARITRNVVRDCDIIQVVPDETITDSLVKEEH